MEKSEILALYDQQQRIDIEIPGMRKEVLPRLVRFTRPVSGTNFVLYSGLDEADLDRVIEEQIAHFRPMRQPFQWQTYGHDRPADLKERLMAHGFQPDEPGALMALDLTAAPPGLLAPLPAEADVRPITRRDDLKDVIEIMEQVWGGNFNWIDQRLGDHLELPGYLSMYVAYAEGQPACAAWIYFYRGSQFAGLFGGSTLPAYRGRGLYTSLLAVRAQAALQRGYRFLVIDASPMSEPIVAKHGFQLLARSQSFEFDEHSSRV